MFERFTSEAREAVVHAQEAARETGASHIGTPHLLLGAANVVPGLPAESLRAAVAEGTDAQALAAIGIDLEEVRRRVEAAFGPDALAPRRRRASRRCGGSAIPFAPAAKEALHEALERRDGHIGAGHVVLGVLR